MSNTASQSKSEWKEITLVELTTKIGSGATPRGGSNSYKDEGISLIRSQNVLDLQFTTDGLAFIDHEQADGLKNVIVEEKDVLLNITGDSVARVCMVPNFVLPARVNQHVSIIRADTEETIPEYLLYNLISQKEELLMQSEIGATRKAITKGMIERFELKIPPLEEQKSIAEVLSSLDDKIALLHRQNQTLEQMAEMLFRQWFVEEADEGWEEITFGDLVVPQKGKNITKKGAIDGPYPVVAGGLEPSCYHNASNTKEPVVTISASGANAGYIRLYTTKIWSSDSSFIDYSVTPFVYFSYIFLKINQTILFDKQTGSAQPHIYPAQIMELDCLNYPKNLIHVFENWCKPNFEKIKSNQTQIHTLTALRDTLLPKLMRGEVRVEMGKTTNG